MSRAFFSFGPSCYLLLLLALRVGLITLFACALGMLLSTLRMLHALCVISLAVLVSGGAVRLCSIFVKFGGFVVIAVRHMGSLNSAPSARQYARSSVVPDVTEWCCRDTRCSIWNHEGFHRLSSGLVPRWP
jgi:hypothetical protein